MSIILDALKKAETERHLGKLPSLHSPSSTATRSGAASTHKLTVALWLGGATAGLLVAAGAGWLYWNEGAPAQKAALVLPHAVVKVATADREIPVPPPLPAPLVTIKPAQVAAAKAVQSAPPVSDKPATTASTPDKIVALTDLPPALQRELPALVIGGSMYSDNAADRMLLVDKRLLHEGDEAGPGIVLEKIMPKEAILRYRNARFRINF